MAGGRYWANTMPDPDDLTLLRRFAHEHAEDAFAELVRRHVGLVFHAALRQVGTAARAEEVAQTVFIILAQKAATLTDRPVLAGWLHTATRLAALKAWRTEQRRRRREQEAHAMQTSESEPDPGWERLRPVIDEVLHALDERDRDAVILRFFAGCSFAEIGVRCSLAEDAARKRVERALDKMHAALARRGITSTAAALGSALAAHAQAAVPAGVAASVTATALSASAAWSGAAGALTLFAMTKIEIGLTAAVLIALVVIGGSDLRANRDLRARVARAQSAATDLDAAQEEKRQLQAQVAAHAPVGAAGNELVLLQARAAQLRARPRWVAEADKKLIAAAKNAGWASDTAAIETTIWARVAGDRIALANNFAWIGDAKMKADAAFARLSERLQAKFGSADRLAGAALFGAIAPGVGDYTWTKAGEVNVTPPVAGDALVGYWVDPDPDARAPRVGAFLRVRAWAQYASGQERTLVTDLCYDAGRWTLGTSIFSEAQWEKMVNAFDPATGERR
jgi:RNA polymerase sigma factor (sigma-70 family)